MNVGFVVFMIKLVNYDITNDIYTQKHLIS